MKFGQLMSYYKRKRFMKKFHKTCDLEISSRPFCVCKELSTTYIGKWNFWSKLLTLGMYKQNYQNLSKLVNRPPQIPFYRKFLKTKKGLELVSRPYFLHNVLMKNFPFVMLHKLAKFHHQTVFISQVIQWNVFCASWLDIWWRHDIWMSENLKANYLKYKKSFQSEIKNIFSYFKCALF